MIPSYKQLLMLLLFTAFASCSQDDVVMEVESIDAVDSSLDCNANAVIAKSGACTGIGTNDYSAIESVGETRIVTTSSSLSNPIFQWSIVDGGNVTLSSPTDGDNITVTFEQGFTFAEIQANASGTTSSGTSQTCSSTIIFQTKACAQ